MHCNTQSCIAVTILFMPQRPQILQDSGAVACSLCLPFWKGVSAGEECVGAVIRMLLLEVEQALNQIKIASSSCLESPFICRVWGGKWCQLWTIHLTSPTLAVLLNTLVDWLLNSIEPSLKQLRIAIDSFKNNWYWHPLLKQHRLCQWTEIKRTLAEATWVPSWITLQSS